MNNKNFVAIIDYEMGNLFSVKRACEQTGMHPVVTSDPSVVMRSIGAILPGVGAFGDAMDNLRRLDLVSAIKEFIKSDRPFMGVCLGLQLLMTESEEFGHHRGLDIIPGNVIKFSTRDRTKVPQVGWNRVYRPSFLDESFWSTSLFRGVANDEYMYFVHSYYVIPQDARVILSSSNYKGTEYCSSVGKGNLFACQFHPEKSAQEGIKIYENFAKLVCKG